MKMTHQSSFNLRSTDEDVDVFEDALEYLSIDNGSAPLPHGEDLEQSTLRETRKKMPR